MAEESRDGLASDVTFRYLCRYNAAMTNDEWLTINEAAEHLQTNRVKIWRLIKAGRLEVRENPLDRREKLIPLLAIQELERLGRK